MTWERKILEGDAPDEVPTTMRPELDVVSAGEGVKREEGQRTQCLRREVAI